MSYARRLELDDVVDRWDASFGQQGARWQSTILRGEVAVDRLGDEEKVAYINFDDPDERYSRDFDHTPAVFFDAATDVGVAIDSVSSSRLSLRFDPEAATEERINFTILAVGRWEPERTLFD